MQNSLKFFRSFKFFKVDLSKIFLKKKVSILIGRCQSSSLRFGLFLRQKNAKLETETMGDIKPNKINSRHTHQVKEIKSCR